ncbi:formate hydrogenlyase maturation HycH family protein [Photobacterium phosphoreum]|uniref:formate hydrogenlyase maturation HycH family protein n=1 Tax=Photobacterium phosphoreum TaxID=659 RepID=UPI0005D4046C|nr:formate hydrogenlyase maturation HycH family protein [Photobacterium phosphoreum]KJF87464.1 formate hydrogenlyase maturation protein HycH [Photobacterium phosphoreum]MCD9461980.1 formate hydrogenlyase maturation protein HycH [Photobacterium phosphoreum]OBU47380.1 formate hydrogenlyase maturation protein HycH [Photobacterium phosphoreum]PQJ86228.1 formate hydrogenlyase maturation protein HycH [Photobacterium phosphoreum]PSU59194.1 formate hydrogenlyase maturation protein HycH [Photobacterium
MSDVLAELTQSRHFQGHVYFYTLGRKFVDESYDVPEEAKQIMYYSLAIGHHLGVVDCLKAVIECEGDEYLTWISGLPQDGEAFNKMKGYFVFGEITIYPEHLNMLALAFDRIDTSTQNALSQQLTRDFIAALGDIHREPTMYMMIRGIR